MDVFTPNPLKVQLLPAWDSRAVDLIWRPSGVTGVIGYHVWRASNAPSNFVRLTNEPLQTTFFRDTTRVASCRETPAKWESSPTSANGVVMVRTKNTPLCKPELDRDNKPILATPYDLQVVSKATGKPFQLERVEPHNGGIMFGNRSLVDSEKMDIRVSVDLPSTLEDLQIDYFYIDRFTDSSFGRDLFYKITEVFEGFEGDPDTYPAISNLDLDPADIWWREAMRRNRFIFEQVGEPAYIILKKTTGAMCKCVDVDTMKPRSNCMHCWGVGFPGGYDGPYPITYTPPNAAIQVKQNPEGKSRTRSVQSFIGPSPILSGGDIIFRFNGERVVVLDVERTSVRGTTLQQTYTTELLKPSDFRNTIQIVNPNYPLLLISTNLPAFRNTDHSFEDPVPSNISLLEGVSTHMISDPTQDVTKVENAHPEDMRTNTVPSTSPVFENWSF